MDKYHVEEVNGKFSVYNHRRVYIAGPFDSRDQAQSFADNQPAVDRAVLESREDTRRLFGGYYDPSD